VLKYKLDTEAKDIIQSCIVCQDVSFVIGDIVVCPTERFILKLVSGTVHRIWRWVSIVM